MDKILEMEGIQKSFPGVKALKNVTFSVAKGEVHALVGENGAGKSTLMKILSGAYSYDTGEIRIDGKPVADISPRRMLELGVGVIYQELTLAPHLTVAENIFMGRLPKTRFGQIDWKRLDEETVKIGEQLGLKLYPSTPVGKLSVSQRQMVEIAKALSRESRIIVLDEPSAVLGDSELQGLFAVINRLAERGVSFIYISHRLSEVFQISHRVTVLKDGQVVGTDDVENMDTDRLIKMMVGRELSDVYPDRTSQPGKMTLKVTGLSRRGVLHDISINAHAGEIIGISGLAGTGRTELLRAIVGADVIDSGEIEVFGKKVRIKSPRAAISLGMGILPEDRKTEGLFLGQSVMFNVTIAKLSEITRGGRLSTGMERRKVQDYIKKLDVRPPLLQSRMKNLSGGNQQKCVFAKWLNANCRILLIDEPTRGVDVGAKREIYQLLADLAAGGVTIVMVSSELPEILGLSDRVYVMRQGRIAAELNRSDASEELIMRHATGTGG